MPSATSCSSSATRSARSSPSSPSSSPSAAKSICSGGITGQRKVPGGHGQAARRGAHPAVHTPPGTARQAGVRWHAQNHRAVIVLGIDPGLANTGYGVVARRDGRLVALDGGVIETRAGRSAGAPSGRDPRRGGCAAGRARARRGRPRGALLRPERAHARSPSARPAASSMLAAGQRGVPCASYTPQQVKGAVCGSGRAQKDQVARMVKTLLGLAEEPRPDHAADALAVAVCHANCAPLAMALACAREGAGVHDGAGRTDDRAAAGRGRGPPRRPRGDPLRRASATARRSPRRRCATCPPWARR